MPLHMSTHYPMTRNTTARYTCSSDKIASTQRKNAPPAARVEPATSRVGASTARNQARAGFCQSFMILMTWIFKTHSYVVYSKARCCQVGNFIARYSKTDYCTLIQKSSQFNKPGDDIGPKRSNGQGSGSHAVPADHWASKAFKKCIFSTFPKFTIMCRGKMVINPYVLYL